MKMFAGPLALQLETPTRSAAPFSFNKPDRIYADQRASRVADGITIHTSGERSLVVANAWLGSPDVRTHLQYIVSADPAYALHVRENAIELITAAVQLDVLVPVLVVLGRSKSSRRSALLRAGAGPSPAVVYISPADLPSNRRRAYLRRLAAGDILT